MTQVFGSSGLQLADQKGLAPFAGLRLEAQVLFGIGA